jgi:hypothetical protein
MIVLSLAEGSAGVEVFGLLPMYQASRKLARSRPDMRYLIDR